MLAAKPPRHPLLYIVLQNTVYSPVLAGGLIQSTEHIVKEDAARLAVDIVTVASFPELLQVICVL